MPVPPFDYASVRARLGVADRFPGDVLAAADAAAKAGPAPADRRDARSLPLVTIDPAGSRDLDQALHVEASGHGGFRVHYAIADVAAFVTPGGPVDREARARGETLYCPDLRVPLHPPVLGEGAMSLLPSQDRPAVLWEIEVDPNGQPVRVDVGRAVVRSTAQLDYETVQAALDGGDAPEAARALAALGQTLTAASRARGAVDLGLADQEVRAAPDGRWALTLRRPLPVERWNAQVSLLTGMAAARIMAAGGAGLLRTVPDPAPDAITRLRATAAALRVPWAQGEPVGHVLARVRPDEPIGAALLEEAAELLRGAAYTPLHEPTDSPPRHGGVGAPYAHVTAPIRRLCDRATTEVCLALNAGREVPEWALTAIDEMPELMRVAGERARQVDRAVVDHTEAALLAGRVGEEFAAVVVDVRASAATVLLDDPPVRATAKGAFTLGETARVRLVGVDVGEGRVHFSRS